MKIHKLLALLFFMYLVSGYSYAQDKTVTLVASNISIKSALEQIEKKSDYLVLVMDDAQRDLNKKVSVNMKDRLITEVLTYLLKGTNLTFTLVERQITIKKTPVQQITHATPVSLTSLSPTASSKTIRGVVLDKDRVPVIGARVVEVNTPTNGTITNADGEFQLSVSENSDISISFIGYAPQEFSVSNTDNFEIVLVEDNALLKELVVVGYGTQRKETITGAISVLDNTELMQNPVANISNSLVGRIPGVTSIQASGEPGYNSSSIRIRGVSTLNTGGQEPLVVIDGIQSTMSVLNTMDPNDIENISVLKDASATSIYGVRGANGVIILTTKRGTSGAPKISLSYNYGVTRLATKVNMLDSYSYALFKNEAILNDNDVANFRLMYTDDQLWKFQNNRDFTPAEVESMNLSPDKKAALLAMPSLHYQNHDYIDEYFGGTAPQQQVNVNLSGGNSNVTYFTSVGYFSQDGIINNSNYDGYIINPSYNRYNFRSNIDIEAIKNIKISFDASNQFENRRNMIGSGDNVMDMGIRNKQMLGEFYASQPFAGPGFYNGKLITGYIGLPDIYPSQPYAGTGISPIANTYNKPMLESNSSYSNINLRIAHKMDYLLEGLSLSGAVSYNDLYTKTRRFQKSVRKYTMMRDPNDPTNLILYEEETSTPVSIVDNFSNYKMRKMYYEGKLYYENTFDKHSLTGMILFNINRLSNPGLEYNVPNTIVGSAARFTYDYDRRYLFELNTAYNGSENFPPGKRFGFFPAFSLGWVISNEPFFKENNFLSWLKIRGSYGIVGNDMIGGARFLYLPDTWTQESRGYYFGISSASSRPPYYPGASQSSAGNPLVTWERAKKVNVGLEANFFKNRLTFVGDVFDEKRDNILWLSESVPVIVSQYIPSANIGKVYNKGYEIQLGWRDKVANDFRYSIKAHVNYARNKIIFMDEPSYQYPWLSTTGFALGQYKGFRTDGFYNSNIETFNRPNATTDGNKAQAGDLRYIDINGDGKIDNNDKVPIGNSNLPRYYFGSTIDLGYKGFDVSVLFTGSYKGSLTMWSNEASYILNPFFLGVANAFMYQYEGRWTPEKAANGIDPSFPRASLSNARNQNGANPSDFWIMPTDFIKLKNIEVSYTFSNLRKLKEIGISFIRLYVNGNNLYTWKHKKLIDGFDPEQADAGGASIGWVYPPTQVYNLGVNIQF